MNMLVIFLRIVEVLVCVLLVGVILIQRTKGSGAGVSFGGGMGEALFGAQMGDVLTKTTVILGGIFIVNTLALSILAGRVTAGMRSDSLMDSEVMPMPAAAHDHEHVLPPGATGTGAGDAASVLDDLERTDTPPPSSGATDAGAGMVPGETATAPGADNQPPAP